MYILYIHITHVWYITRLQHALVLLVLSAYIIYMHIYIYMHIHTSVDLPMPPGPHSTHLFVVASLLSNQSRMHFSSLDWRWNPYGALTLNTRIAPTLSLSPRAVGALITRGWWLPRTPSCLLSCTAADGKLPGTPSQRHSACGWRAQLQRCTCSWPWFRLLMEPFVASIPAHPRRQPWSTPFWCALLREWMPEVQVSTSHRNCLHEHLEPETESHDGNQRDNVVYWKTKRKIKDDLQCN